MSGEAGRRWIGTDRVLLAAGLLLLAYFLGGVLMLVFAAVLLAVGLDGVATGLSDRTPLPRGWALVVVSVAFLAGLALMVVLIAPRVFEQMGQLQENLLEFAARARDWLAGLGAEEVVADINQNGESMAGAAQDVLARAASWGMTTVGVLANFVVFLVIAFFAAADPQLYRGGFLRLVPSARRVLVDETLSMAAYALRWWFLGQLVSMAILGVTVGLGLFVIGLELWLALALITALLTFIPFLGPLIAGVPVLIVAFAQGVETGLIVAAFYLVVQNLEGNVLVPMIQRRAVNLPPALLISVQILLSVVFGIMGLILAAPLTVVAMVAVKKLYLEAVLGDRDAAEL